mgnify:CR=1 FL=1
MINNNVSQSNISIGKAINNQSNIFSSTSSVPSGPVSSTSTFSTHPSNTTIGLEKGQIIKGEVVDLRSNEVSVKLEDGRVLTGKLEDGNHLSIGENVTFRVEEVSLKSLSLKILSESQVAIQDNTIDKALEAAGLGKNSRNRVIVKALLNQQMPIDKGTIGLLIKQSLAFKDTSIDTLVFMNKYHIPVSKENIEFLKSLSNSEQNIVKDIASLTNEIPNLFEELSSKSSSELMTQGNNLLNAILNNHILNEFIDNQDISIPFQSSNVTGIANDTLNNSEMLKQAKDLNDNLNSIMNSNDSNRNLNTTTLLDNSILSAEDRLSLVKFLESDPEANLLFSENLPQKVMDGTANINEVTTLLKEAFQLGSFSETNNLLNDKILSSIQHVLSTFEAMQNNNPMSQINTYLSHSDRMNLLQALDDFSLPQEVKSQIQSGDISTHKLLQWIQNKLSAASESSISKLFSSKEYKTLIQEELLSKWTLTPKSLIKEGTIDNYYDNLTKQLTELKEFISSSFGDSKENLYGQTGHLQENINSIIHINEFFTYFQLPIKFQEQVANSKLFVYSRKKEKHTAEEGISVLLHLDMEHLGPLDIHINLHNINIVSKFYINDEDTSNLISSNMPLLEAALEKKGYTFHAEVLIREKDMDIVEEFTKQEENTSPVHRYNFDIRA